MKTLSFIALFMSFALQAETFVGKVERFQGHFVEVPRAYDYYALSTSEGHRILLPAFLNAEMLEKAEHTVIISGDFERLLCTDMSRACPTGAFVSLDDVVIDSGLRSIRRLESYSGVVELDQYGLGVIDGFTALPSFIDSEKMLRHYPLVEASLSGVGFDRMLCIMPGPGCGLRHVMNFAQLELKF